MIDCTETLLEEENAAKLLFYDDSEAMSGLSRILAKPSPVCTCRKKAEVPDQPAGMKKTLYRSDIARLTFTSAALASTMLLGAAQAATPIVVSAYSSTAAAHCWITGPGRVEDSPTRMCRGKATLMVLVNKDEARDSISVGRDRDDAEKQPAAQTSFGPFKQALPGIEWRIAGGNPFAIIQRWRMIDVPDAKPLLVVSRLPPGAVCPVAYVDAAANPDADELARKAADETARDFTCGKDRVKILGAGGRAAELTTAH
jgi:hypothetical protein